MAGRDHALVMLQITRGAFITAHRRSNRGDLHDFDVFADRTLASDACAGFSVASLTAIAASPGRA
jgi:hypothetical protein